MSSISLFLVAFLACMGFAAAITGTVVVASGNTLKVHSQPTTTSTTLYSLNNGAVETILCYTTGDSVSGSQGTTSKWYQISGNGNGYASAAYMTCSGTPPSCSTGAVTGTVVVASGTTLKVHSQPSTTSTTLYSLDNGAKVTITCAISGESVSGSQGTTSKWYEVNGNGYASAAYMTASGSPSTCSASTNSTFQMAFDYGKKNIGTIYVGCAGGTYRFGVVAPYDMYHDGTTCGQSRVYFQPKGSVGFDCSGLMVEMFAAAGINMPYQSSTAIKDNVPEVSKSNIRNGDMLAKYGHVVMYIGNNQVMESTPYTQNADSSWTGTRINSASSYMSSTDYTAHRYPGFY